MKYFAALILLPSLAFAGPLVPNGSPINVRMAPYNAKGNDSADDTAAIAAALTAANSGTVKRVFIPAGTYDINTANLVPPSNVTIIGDGIGRTVLKRKGTGASRYLFSIASAQSNVTISDMTMTTTNDANAASAGVFISSAATDIRIKNNEIYYFYDYGFRANTASTRVTIQGNNIHDITQGASCTGINASFLTDSIVADNTIHDVGLAPGNWAIYSSNNLVNSQIRGNTVYNTYGGIKVTSTTVTHKGVIIANNNVQSTIGAEAIVFGYIQGATISGNSLYNNPAGILCDGQVTGFAITGNNVDFNGAGSSGGKAISLGNDTCTNGAVTGNTLIGTTTRDGVNVTNADHVAITGNTFRDFQHAIYLNGSGVTDITINGNMFWSSSNKPAVATATAANVQVVGNYNYNANTAAFFVDLGTVTGAFVADNVTNTDTVGRTTGSSSNVVIERNAIGTATQISSVSGTNIVVRENGPLSQLLRPRDDTTISLSGHVGGGQGSATALPSRLNIGSCASDHDSFILPAALQGEFSEVKITGSKICDIYPASGEDAGSGTNTAVSISSGASKVFRGQSTGTWFNR